MSGSTLSSAMVVSLVILCAATPVAASDPPPKAEIGISNNILRYDAGSWPIGWVFAVGGNVAPGAGGESASAVAQEGVPPAYQPRITQEAIRHAVFATMHDTTLPNPVTQQSAAAPATGPNRSWDTLIDTVKKGEKVTVTLMTATKVEGNLLAIDVRSISVDQPEGPRTIETADVFRVRHAGVRGRHAKWGALIGASAMAIVGAIAAREPTTHTESDGSTHTINSAYEAALISAIFFGLPAGAIGGAVVPIGQPLYEAANVVRKTP